MIAAPMEPTTPFKPTLVGVGGKLYQYDDGRIYGMLVVRDTPAGPAVNITDWNAHHRYRAAGHSVTALRWLRERYVQIVAVSVGTLDEDGVGDIATGYWAHMKCRGLLDELIDDNGQFLDVSADETVTLRPEEVANPEQESPA